VVTKRVKELLKNTGSVKSAVILKHKGQSNQTMNYASRLFMGLVIAAALVACRDKAAEKRIAELEARLNSLEGNKATTTPAATAPADAAATPETKPEGPLPTLDFERTDYDFGTIREGQKVNFTYKFKNNGTAPLIVQNVQPSCGCTAPDWTKEPIPVGGTGFVKVEFDSSGKPGMQNKMVTVTSNTWPKQMKLNFKAMVTPKPDGASGPVK
jgi:hypothetical protein